MFTYHSFSKSETGETVPLREEDGRKEEWKIHKNRREHS
jgi:hypothetical protein